MGSHVGTGYKSNYRPVVSYQPHLDTLDSPAMGYVGSTPSPTPAWLDLALGNVRANRTAPGSQDGNSALPGRGLVPSVGPSMFVGCLGEG